jgi:hypothetical protein
MRRVVGCLSENTLQGFVAGSLSSDAHALARRHIETCSDCRTLAVELTRDGERDAGEAEAVPPGAAPRAVQRPLAERFELVRPLGRGGMGVVYEALDRERGTRVALKTLQHVSADGLLRPSCHLSCRLRRSGFRRGVRMELWRTTPVRSSSPMFVSERAR